MTNKNCFFVNEKKTALVAFGNLFNIFYDWEEQAAAFFYSAQLITYPSFSISSASLVNCNG